MCLIKIFAFLLNFSVKLNTGVIACQHWQPTFTLAAHIHIASLLLLLVSISVHIYILTWLISKLSFATFLLQIRQKLLPPNNSTTSNKCLFADCARLSLPVFLLICQFTFHHDQVYISSTL